MRCHKAQEVPRRGVCPSILPLVYETSIHLATYPSTPLSTHLPAYTSTYVATPSIHPSIIYPSIHPAILPACPSTCPSILLSISSDCLSIHPSPDPASQVIIYPTTHLSIHPYAHPSSIHLSTQPSYLLIHPHVHPFIHSSHLSIHLSFIQPSTIPPSFIHSNMFTRQETQWDSVEAQRRMQSHSHLIHPCPWNTVSAVMEGT